MEDAITGGLTACFFLDGADHVEGLTVHVTPLVQTAMNVRSITGPFQGGWLDPILPGDPRFQWGWLELSWAAATVQTGSPDGVPGDWIY